MPTIECFIEDTGALPIVRASTKTTDEVIIEQDMKDFVCIEKTKSFFVAEFYRLAGRSYSEPIPAGLQMFAFCDSSAEVTATCDNI